jgi:hypothetical protein
VDNNVPAIGLDALVAGVGVPFGAVLALGVLAAGSTLRWAGQGSRVGVYCAGGASVLLNLCMLVCASSLLAGGASAWWILTPSMAVALSLVGVVLPPGGGSLAVSELDDRGRRAQAVADQIAQADRRPPS